MIFCSYYMFENFHHSHFKSTSSHGIYKFGQSQVELLLSPLKSGPVWLRVVNQSDCFNHSKKPALKKIPWRGKWQPTPVFLPGKSPWTKEPGGLQSVSMGLPESRTWLRDWSLSVCVPTGLAQALVSAVGRMRSDWPAGFSQFSWREFSAVHISLSYFVAFCDCTDWLKIAVFTNPPKYDPAHVIRIIFKNAQKYIFL